MRHGRIGVLALVVVPANCLLAQSNYQVAPLRGLGGSVQAMVEGTSPAGTVGASVQLDGGLYSGAPTLWQGTTVTALAIPAGYQGVATGINSSGIIIGAVHVGAAPDPQAVLWHNGQIQMLDTLGMVAGVPYGINSSGTVAGYVYGGTQSVQSQAVLWNGGQATALTGFSIALGVNDSGQVLVDGEQGEGVWSNNSFTAIQSLDGALNAQDINNVGHVVGGMNITSGTATEYGFIWKDGTTTALPALPQDTFSFAVAINDNDLIVGNGYNASSGTHALLWDGDQVFDLNDLIPANSGWTLYEATDIGNDGTIVGDGSFNGQISAFELTPSASPSGSSSVPEPASAATLGVAGLLLLRRRRRA